MSSEQDKSQTGETPNKTISFAECMEQMMSACGPEMKKWMESCTSNMSEGCLSCCIIQIDSDNTGKK